MKKRILTLLLILGLFVKTYAQNTGIGTQTPTNTLHIKPFAGTDPVRIEGVKGGSGQYLLLDKNGVVKTSTEKSNLAFVLPNGESMGGTNSVNLTKIQEKGAIRYNEDDMPGTTWTKMPGLEMDFEITERKNTLNVSVQGGNQYYSTISVNDAWVAYGIGIFVDGRLKIVRAFIHSFDTQIFPSDLWTVLGQINGLSVGKHKIEVYATRRSSTNAPNEYVIGNAFVNSDTRNHFMHKATLMVNGVYN